MNKLVYLGVVVIWGTTWFAIALQQGEVSILVSIFWRFTIAGGLLLLINRWRLGKTQLTWRDHGFCLLQGLCAFSLNFYCFYLAASQITTGIESVIFSMAILFNAINQAIFYRVTPVKRFWPAAALGIIGITILFSDQWGAQYFSVSLGVGVGLSLVGTYGFSLGNMLSIRHQRRGLAILTTNSWAMCYGAAVAGILAYFYGYSFTLPAQPLYLGALFYLALFGSVIGFGAYYFLVGRIGAGQAAYTTVLFPLVALTISTRFEGYQWHPHAVVGLGIILLGNFIMFFPVHKFGKSRLRLPVASAAIQGKRSDLP
ncbi:DMT family transporter [Rosenbergiella sp. S61]|uniref:DMT family transporter n=1 Tax=Rosenbergiella gaditana TaxID=2726987 RepID=A0ABS5SYH6_9GAMM|nr:DMT family transporter [Rosenbergiella gaditana]MBT0724962.1 DMT family transporter [Rosenbergiella gaditana]